MQASAKTVGQILEPRGQFVIPFFQRHYSWEQKQWRRLWADILKLLDVEADSPRSNAVHFLGPLVTIPLTATPGSLPAWQLIDGQQRLTTLTLLLSALRDICNDTANDSTAAEITDTCLLNPHKTDLDRYKVITRIGDREIFEQIVEGKASTSQSGNRLVGGHKFFSDRIRGLAAKAPVHLQRLMAAITARLSLVTITLEGENPYEIFESLNATGLPLEESDLIRNYLFMQVPLQEQATFQERSWSKLEAIFGERKATAGIPTDFYRAYLMRGGRYSKQKQTYLDFRAEHQSGTCSPETVVEDLRKFAEFDRWLHDPGSCNIKPLRLRLHQIELLDTKTTRPFAYHLLEKHADGNLTETDLVGCLDDLISFLLRRSICGESTRQYARWLVEMINEFDGGQPRGSMQQYYARRGWPSDEQFIEALRTFPIYLREFGKARLILEGLERGLNPRELIDGDGISIEHVLPRTLGEGQSGKTWRQALGENWAETHERVVHVIGNLSLTGANSDMGNREFSAKRAILAESRFLLNREIAHAEDWTTDAIEERSRDLAERVAKLWPRPAGLPSTSTARAARKSRTETKQAKTRYWEAILPALQDLDFIDQIPQPRTFGLIGLPLTRKAFRYGLRPRFNKRSLSLLLFLRGDDRERNFDALLADRSEIENAVGSPLLWRKDVRWSTSTSVIELISEGLDPNDESTFAQQGDWFVEQLRRFHTAFHDRCTALAPDDTPRKMTPIRRKRQRWWTLVLAEVGKSSDILAGRRPPAENWIGSGSGVSGVSFNLGANKTSSSVELYIDRGEDHDAENKLIFDKLQEHRPEIELTFGEPLEWDRLNDKRASRIRWIQSFGCGLPEKEWPKATAAQAEAMIRFHSALSPKVKGLAIP